MLYGKGWGRGARGGGGRNKEEFILHIGFAAVLAHHPGETGTWTGSVTTIARGKTSFLPG